jgi:hypothetical protein
VIFNELYNVIVQRKLHPTQVQLNYVDKHAAEAAFRRVLELANGTAPEKRPVFEDYFGAKIAFDAADIGIVIFVDAKRSSEMQAGHTFMQAKEQQKLNMEAQKSPLLNGTLVGQTGNRRPA